MKYKDFEYDILEDNTIEITKYLGNEEYVVIPSKIEDLEVKSIGEYAFWYCDVSSIEIPDSVINIGDSAFEFCTSLTSITIGNNVTSIGNWAFRNCDSLTNIVIPDSVISIGKYAFDERYAVLTSIDVSESNENYSSINGVLFNKDKTELIRYPIGKSDISYVVPDSVTSIRKCAFDGCISLSSVTMGNSVTSIGNSAFRNCDSLTSIELHKNTRYYSNSFPDSCKIIILDEKKARNKFELDKE